MHKNAHGTGITISTKTTSAIVGARGYSGIELARLLLDHPNTELTACYATQKFAISDYILESKAKKIPSLTENELNPNMADVWFLATPAEVSLKLGAQLVDAGKKVIDLSGAYRLKTSSYEKWYNFTHTRNDLLQSASYGLAPFTKPITTKLISNPGCYATAILMALIPLFKKDLISNEIVIDAKSGTSGAGKKANESQLFAEVSGDLLPYRTGKHQHLPEITETVKNLTGVTVDLQMTTHLVPVDRGISVAIYAKPKTTDISEIEKAYQEAYEGYPLVRLQKGDGPLLKMKNVVHTPYTHITYDMIDNKLYVFSMIDNLLKGAASQAVENFNRLMDVPLATGLIEGE